MEAAASSQQQQLDRIQLQMQQLLAQTSSITAAGSSSDSVSQVEAQRLANRKQLELLADVQARLMEEQVKLERTVKQERVEGSRRRSPPLSTTSAAEPGGWPGQGTPVLAQGRVVGQGSSFGPGCHRPGWCGPGDCRPGLNSGSGQASSCRVSSSRARWLARPGDTGACPGARGWPGKQASKQLCSRPRRQCVVQPRCLERRCSRRCRSAGVKLEK